MLPSVLVMDATPSKFAGLEALILGSIVLVLMSLYHGIGINWVMRMYKTSGTKLIALHRRPWHASYLFAWTTFFILVLHLTEISAWATILFAMHLTPNLHDSIYFCANSYTTLGLGDVLVPHAWREISPIMAISGLFTFGFTTGVLFNLIGQHDTLVEQLSSKHRQ